MSTIQITPTSPTLSSRAEWLKSERRARHFWVTIVVGLLSLQVAGGITSVFLALNDPSAAIRPRYHDAALNWDTTRRALQLSGQLGWQISYAVGELDEHSQARELRIAIVDDTGSTIENLHLAGELFHHARGKDVHKVSFTEVTSGVFAANIAIAKPGVWQCDLLIQGDHGTAAESRELIVK